MSRQYRQGDVLLCAIDAIPRDARPVSPEGERVVVAAGELSGHAHAFGAECVMLLQQRGPRGRSFVALAGDAELRHEEHLPILVPKGHYEIRHQREYALAVPRLVAD